jgi:4-hydroxyacetophenone monooxygenase
MTFTASVEPIAAGDDAIRAALEDAFLPALLPALAQATGDLSILRDDLRLTAVQPGVPQGGMTDAQQQLAKDIALDAIKRLRERDGDPPRAVSDADLGAILDWLTNSQASADYVPLMLEELAPADADPRAPDWTMPAATAFSVAVIGAGMSGILAAIRLKQAGIPFTIIEKNTDVGGTWFENTYPGARVDVPSAFYSYSFAQKIDWPKFFSPQQVLLDYFRAVADDYGLREHTRFGTEVLSMAFDDARAVWSLRLRTPDGREETLETNAVVSAVGQLNRPNIPKIRGLESFAGPRFHSAQWDHSVDLKGKRVAVIGTGASAAQFVPVIAEEAAQLHVYQRTPNWFVPVPTYHDDVPAGLQGLLRHVPHYAHWYRFWMFWSTTDGLLPAATVNDAWPDKSKSVSQENEILRLLLGGYISGEFASRPDLLEKVMPQYPPASKRIILDNGAWAAAMKRDNVQLITDPIREITPRGVITEDGTKREADVLIYGTGFTASEFLMPMQVTGRNGVDLREQWGGDARAYMGIVVPNFPNFFMLYGPNTNIVVNGSIIYFSECEVQYVLGCLRLLVLGESRALDVKRDVHDAYNRRIDEGNSKRAWGVGSTNSWYKNARGHVTQNWPFNVIEYWQQTREPNPNDFEFF